MNMNQSTDDDLTLDDLAWIEGRSKDQRQCIVCSEWKDKKEFYGQIKKGHYYLFRNCKLCNNERSEQWKQDNKDFVKKTIQNYSRKRLYGINSMDWDKLFESQDKSCALCKSIVARHPRGGWCTDHDHITGRIRGILCGPCNLALGQYEKTIRPMLDKVEAYLDKTR
jgi:hypothetical protein